MQIKAGTSLNRYKYEDTIWEWEDDGYLIQVFRGEEQIMQLEFEELIAVAAGMKEVHDKRLKDKLLNIKNG